MRLSLATLNSLTALLPLIKLKKTKQIIGKDTVSAINSGVYWGYLILLATFCTAFAFVQSVRIMRYLSPFTVMLTIAMEPVYGILIALFLFGASEAMTPGFYLGVATILAMLLGDAYMKRRKRRKAI